MVKRTKLIVVILFIIMLGACILYISSHFVEKIIVNIGPTFQKNIKTAILFSTKPGCSKTDFEYTDEFLDNSEIKDNNIFLVTNFEEYEKTVKKYFQLNFLTTITPEHFLNNNLVFIILNYPDGYTLWNPKIRSNNDNKYIFSVELWEIRRRNRSRCMHDKMYILEIGK